MARLRLTLGLAPLSERWGMDRGKSICRYYLEQFLEELASDVRGHCLEFADDGYIRKYGRGAVDKVDILNVDSSNPRATLVADVTRPNQIPGDTFDCIICTHVLHVIYDLDAAVDGMYRILKPGGVLLVGVPHVSMAAPESNELWRFTQHGLHALLARRFSADRVTVRAYGSSLTAAGQIRGLATHEFTRAELAFTDPRFAVEVCGRAVK